MSAAPYAELNLGDHVGDTEPAVAENRRRLREALALPGEPDWLQQVHGSRAVVAGRERNCEADASFADRPGVVCAVLTADCLPVLFCDRAGTRVAAAHAGWRGLQAGILERAVERFTGDRSDILAWLGPAIGPEAFEVGEEVRDAFLTEDPGAAAAFRPSADGRWLADLYTLARRRLERAGVGAVFGGGWCTFTDAEHFYSYRRDGTTGRMAALVWLSGESGRGGESSLR